MRLENSGRQRSTGAKDDKALITRCANTHKTCQVLQAELDAICDHGTLPKTELNKLSKRIKALDRTASAVLTALR